MRFYEIINESSPKEEERLKRAREQGYNVDDPHYHGTPGGDFDEFDPERTADEDLAYGAGVYMSRDPDAASGYSIPGSSWGNSDHDREQARPTVYKVFHRLKNPFDLQKLYPYPEVKRILTHCFTPQELQHIELWQELMNDVAYESRYAEEIDELHEQLMNIGYSDVEIDPDDYEDGEDDPDFIKDRDDLLDDKEKSLKQRIARLEGWEAEAQAAHNKALADGKIGNVYGRDIYRTLWTNTDGYHDWKAESQLFGGETETIEFKTEANRWLEELGYDGLTHIDRYNPGNKGVAHSVTIAFRPQHVRSAHANFDPDKIDSPKLSEDKKQKSNSPDYDDEQGLGSRDYRGKKHLSKLYVMMKPSVFHHLVANNDDNIDYIMAHMKSGKPISTPYIEVDFSKNIPVILGHEGRTRMNAIKRLYGDHPVKVALLSNSGWDTRKISLFNKEVYPHDFCEEHGWPTVKGPFFTNGISESYSEKSSTFGDNGDLYRLNDIFKATEKSLVFDVPVSKLTWQLDKEEDEERIEKADCSVPILVWKKGNRLVLVDGMHRLKKAIKNGIDKLPAKYVLDTIMKKALISESISSTPSLVSAVHAL